MTGNSVSSIDTDYPYKIDTKSIKHLVVFLLL